MSPTIELPIELAISSCGAFIAALAVVRLVRSDNGEAFETAASFDAPPTADNESSRPQLFGNEGGVDSAALLPMADDSSVALPSPSQTVADALKRRGNVLKLRCELFVVWAFALCAVTSIVSASIIYEAIGNKTSKSISRTTIEALFAQTFLEGATPLFVVVLFGLPSSAFVTIRALTRRALVACGMSSRKYRNFKEKLLSARHRLNLLQTIL